MLKRIWESMELATYEDWARIREGIRALNPKICGFDTETTGLHIILDKPFLFQFGFAHPTNEHKGYTFLVDLRVNKDAERIISEWHEICSKADVYLGCNITFDLHMLRNIGIEYGYDNVAELRAYIRYSGDAIQTEHGGPPLKLKDFTAMYVDPSAKYHERLLKNERSAIAKSYNLKLKMMLSHLGAPPKEYKANSYTLSVIEKMFKDPLFDESDLEDKVKEVYLRWKQEVLPQYLQDKVQSIVETDMIRYTELDTKTLYKYAHLDVVYLIEDYEKVLPILKYRHNEKAVELDNSLIYPFLDMECTGFLVDKEYLESARVKLKEYTLARRQVFKQLAGCDIKIGQHEKILEILRNKYHADVSSTNSDVLQTFKNQLLRENKKDEVIGFIDVLSELRTLEKWYATYIVRFQKALKYTDRLYTQIDAQGAVSGRISSDFQQFPKEPIKTIDGEEIFHPRRFVIVPDNCKGLLYLDYSQIELRFQAMYTILVGEPDLNMCRAYMPYKCHNHQGVEFDYKNPGHIKKWNEEWFTDESNEKWIKTDVHGATTLSAFKSMGLTKDSPNFHALRYVGKRVNFA